MKILILGIGNLLFGDEGIGVHFIKYIEEKYQFDGEHQIDTIDGGTLAQRLIPIIVEYDHLIIIDTINAPGVQAGEVYFFNFDAVPDNVDWQGSAHEVEMLQTLNMMDMTGDRPPTMIMGVVPTIIEITEFSLSEGVAEAVPLMEKTLLEYLKKMNVNAIKKADVNIQSILPNSFRSHDAYSV
ncbi:HyaD/HybD family hydrogenase maturation endopeptidase [Sulfurovum sp. XGS-02]|uniref:HyaD/HybD family hydrogenase maturation endopeptidase n=1 Tax=Sulfurovum sp. XGS-02 TaxID=2925411 RepID=UPI002047F769|nr:HyaD/HybD family hydrogenase maturation endopeptidase [Sulfurovum sp. XGS-02]UPT78469.1 HyaD/HybD family hydrogenase maturation endopeptidase [Sulfurovum sp. XGS-02]